ncbi:MAG TPA: hypothetical protein VFS33_11485, partial [Gemmatimonadales bacterium]|nr:hypothetical protein [Gemmatimonadales bacterium]
MQRLASALEGGVPVCFDGPFESLAAFEAKGDLRRGDSGDGSFRLVERGRTYEYLANAGDYFGPGGAGFSRIRQVCVRQLDDSASVAGLAERVRSRMAPPWRPQPYDRRWQQELGARWRN